VERATRLSDRALSVSPASAEIVHARDAAIMRAVRLRPWSTDALLTVLPLEPGQTSEQRVAARDSAIIRLKVKQLIRSTEEGWVAA
jgi:hypothetical protein